jgi:hypothetical protein
MTYSELRAEDSQILGDALQNSVAPASCRPASVRLYAIGVSTSARLQELCNW